VRLFLDAEYNPDSHQNLIIFLAEVANGKINKQKVCETINPLCADNKVFVKYQAQGGFNPNPPLRAPLLYCQKSVHRLALW